MKKYLLMVLSAISIGLITSCDNNKGDVLKGTWINMVFISGAAEEMDMRYIFDGRGHYTFISAREGMPETRITGSYVIEGNNVHTYYTMQNSDGENIERSQSLTLDLSNNPPSLSAPMYNSEGVILGELVFYKQ